MFCYKIFDAGNEKILAICDKTIVGKTFEKGELVLFVSPSFYGGNECNESSALQLAKQSTIINAVGNEIVGLLIKNDMVNESFVIEIGGVRHAQVVVVV